MTVMVIEGILMAAIIMKTMGAMNRTSLDLHTALVLLWDLDSLLWQMQGLEWSFS